MIERDILSAPSEAVSLHVTLDLVVKTGGAEELPEASAIGARDMSWILFTTLRLAQ
jgi:hypothetical protein